MIYVLCSMTFWQTVLNNSNFYLISLLRKWINSSNKFCQVVQCAKTSRLNVVAKPCTSFTITAYTFFQKYFGKKFLWTCTPSTYSIWIFCLIFKKKKSKYKRCYDQSSRHHELLFVNRQSILKFISIGLNFFTLIVIIIVQIFSMYLDYWINSQYAFLWNQLMNKTWIYDSSFYHSKSTFPCNSHFITLIFLFFVFEIAPHVEFIEKRIRAAAVFIFNLL